MLIPKLGAGVTAAWSLALALFGTAHAAPSKPAPPAVPEIAAVINSNSYGYTLTCVINGHDLGLTGGQSESQRVFVDSSKDADDFSPKERGKYAPLHLGRNTIKITYKRKLPRESFDLNITVEALGYPAPLVYAHLENNDRDAGVFEGAFDLAAKPPAGFKPLVFTTADRRPRGWCMSTRTRAETGRCLRA